MHSGAVPFSARRVEGKQLFCLPLEDTVLRWVQGLGTMRLRCGSISHQFHLSFASGAWPLLFHRDITSVDVGMEFSVKTLFPINIALLYLYLVVFFCNEFFLFLLVSFPFL